MKDDKDYLDIFDEKELPNVKVRGIINQKDSLLEPIRIGWIHEGKWVDDFYKYVRELKNVKRCKEEEEERKIQRVLESYGRVTTNLKYT